MNRKLPSVLLIALLNWGLIISSANAMQPDPQPGQLTSATEEFSTTPSASEGYTPPSLGTPERLEGGGARWNQTQSLRMHLHICTFAHLHV